MGLLFFFRHIKSLVMKKIYFAPQTPTEIGNEKVEKVVFGTTVAITNSTI